MGKFRGHQDKSRRGRENKMLQKKRKAAAGTADFSREPGWQKSGGDVRERHDSRGGDAEGRGIKRKLKQHVTYDKEHSILICGDGDFSFTRGVIRHRGTGIGVVATSLDSRQNVLKKYPRAESWLNKLDADGAQVVHCVDATRLEETLLGGTSAGATGMETEGHTLADTGVEEGGVRGRQAKRTLFDRVVFNFPHTGKQRTHLNRNLIRDFFASTKGLVKCAAAGGEIHVTLKNKRPYSEWNIKAMAKESELVMVRSLAFHPAAFPGYRHSTTDPQAKEFDAGRAKTHVFCRARSAFDDHVDGSGAHPVIVPSAATMMPATKTVEDHEALDHDSDASGDTPSPRKGRNASGRRSTAYEGVFVGAEASGEVGEGSQEHDHDGLLRTGGGKRARDGNGTGGRGNPGVNEKPEDGALLLPYGSAASDSEREEDNASAVSNYVDGANFPRDILRREISAAGEEFPRCKGDGAGDNCASVMMKMNDKRNNGKELDGHDPGADENWSSTGDKEQEPATLRMRKAAKRRAQRKRAADAKKGGAALARCNSSAREAAAGEIVRRPAGQLVGAGDAPKSSHKKRKRGKYVRAAKKV